MRPPRIGRWVALLAVGFHPAASAREAEVTRTSRPGAGTVVGISVAGAVPAGSVDAAFSTLERWEAELSEWRSTSTTRRVMAGETVPVGPQTMHLLAVVEELRGRTQGAFSIVRSGGPSLLRVAGAEGTWSAPAGTEIDLGGVLKGFLADRAAEALLELGVTNFVVDAGGDVVAHGTGPRGRGWDVTVVVAGVSRRVRLRDQALSTSGEDQQPDHIVDRRTGLPVHGLGGVYVVAPEGALADACATADYATSGSLPLPLGVCAWEVAASGGVRRRCGM